MQLPRLFFGASGTSGILALACILDSRPRIISDEESPFVEDFMGPRANLQKEPDRLRGTSLGLAGLDQDRLLASAPGACAWATPFRPFLAKTGGSRGVFVFIAIIFPVRAYRRFIWVSVQASIFLVLLRTSERLGSFFYW